MARGKRHDGRRPDAMRPVTITPHFVRSAAGSCLIEIGNTRVICTASVEPGVPKWREGRGLGWVTAEYGMLPASTGRRKRRPLLKPDSRGTEIQRMIGRVLRHVVRMDRLGENTITLDCDVLEADGGTRTAAITGAWVALDAAAAHLVATGRCTRHPVRTTVAAVSVGMLDGRAVLDLDYAEDSRADVDMNIAMTGARAFVEIQGCAEGSAFDDEDLMELIALSRKGIRRLARLQRAARRKG